MSKMFSWRYLIPFVTLDVQQWSHHARFLHWLTLIWLSIGLVSLYSASSFHGYLNFNDSLYHLKRQLVWLVIGGILFNLVVNIPLKKILSIASIAFLLHLLLIALTFVPGLGTTSYGATRWLSLGPLVAIQPSELIKPWLVLQSALLFANWLKIKPWIRIVWICLFGLMLVLILKQPNLSTTALCGMTMWLIALAGGLPLAYLGITALLGLMMALISISLQSYQRVRIVSFLDPWADPLGNGYQLVQSLLAVGSGQLWGTGLGLSQQKLFYLPFQYTDFIFAIFAEEFGFVGCLLLLLLLSIYATVAWRVANKSTNRTNALIAIGVMVLMVGQSILHIAVAIGVLPTTGLPLPLFSSGGSSLISSLFLTALLIRVAREASQAQVISLR